MMPFAWSITFLMHALLKRFHLETMCMLIWAITENITADIEGQLTKRPWVIFKVHAVPEGGQLVTMLI